MAAKYFTRVSGDGGIGGGMGTSIKHPTDRELMYKANVVLYFMRDGTVEVKKSRYGKTGKLSSEEFLNLMLRMIAQKVYQNNAMMFQEGLVQQLEPMIKDVLEKNKVGVKNDDTL